MIFFLQRRSQLQAKKLGEVAQCVLLSNSGLVNDEKSSK